MARQEQIETAEFSRSILTFVSYSCVNSGETEFSESIEVKPAEALAVGD
jgi:hypothetical protein